MKIGPLTIERTTQDSLYLIHHPYGPLAFMHSATAGVMPSSHVPIEQVAAELQEAARALAEMRRMFGPDWESEVKRFEKVTEEV